jgi:predicted ATPase with chaperone activity
MPMPLLLETTEIGASPAAPSTVEESGLQSEFVTDLVLKVLHHSNGLSGSELAKRIGLGFPILEPSLEFLKTQRFCEIRSGSVLGGASFRFRLTETGHAGAVAAFAQNHYSGYAPVPMAQYLRYLEAFHRTSVQHRVTAEDVRAAFSHLVVSERVLDEVGPAVNSGQSIFMYGPSGNGKTQMARAIRELLPGTIAIPHAVEVGGNIIRFFDPSLHEPVPEAEAEGDAFGPRPDRRWILCRRPMVAVGGELTLEELALTYNPRSGVYRAPIQALANGGVLLIDEFGRQRCPPRDLLNWWMVPLESGMEYLTLQSGEKMEMPFLALVIFATNLKPSDLVDEAFLRRIQYKIYADSPTPDGFVRIFERCCEERQIPFDEQLPRGLLAGFLTSRRIAIRGCQPRDLIEQALSLASYRGLPRALTPELLEAACLSYFIDDRQAPRDRS